jgi:hypothetical protein
MFDAQLKQNLMTAAEFTEADLTANRNGMLSDAQREKLQKSAGMTKVYSLISFVVVMIVIAGIIAYVFFLSPTASSMISSFSKTPEMIYIIGGVFAVVILIVIFSILRTILGSNKLAAGKVSVAEGAAKLKSSRSHEYGFTAYTVKIDKVKFHVTEAVFNSLVENGSYRFYYVKNSPAHMILSIDTI